MRFKKFEYAVSQVTDVKPNAVFCRNVVDMGNSYHDSVNDRRR